MPQYYDIPFMNPQNPLWNDKEGQRLDMERRMKAQMDFCNQPQHVLDAHRKSIERMFSTTQPSSLEGFLGEILNKFKKVKGKVILKLSSNVDLIEGI